MQAVAVLTRGINPRPMLVSERSKLHQSMTVFAGINSGGLGSLAQRYQPLQPSQFGSGVFGICNIANDKFFILLFDQEVVQAVRGIVRQRADNPIPTGTRCNNFNHVPVFSTTCPEGVKCFRNAPCVCPKMNTATLSLRSKTSFCPSRDRAQPYREPGRPMPRKQSEGRRSASGHWT